jgi:hypothetical protein
MHRQQPARRYALLAFGLVVVVDVVAVVLTEGRISRIVQWPVQATAIALIAAYFVFYVRESPTLRLQFGIPTILTIVALAAVDACSWRTNLGPLVTTLIATGLLLYWRLWMRRYEQLGRLSVIFIVILMFFFLWLSVILTGILLEPSMPKRSADAQGGTLDHLPR